MTVVSHVGHSQKVVSATTGATITAQVPVPAGTAPGDLLILTAQGRSAPTWTTVPAPFTAPPPPASFPFDYTANAAYTGYAGSTKPYVFAAFVPAGAVPATYDFGISFSSTRKMVMNLGVWRGVTNSIANILAQFNDNAVATKYADLRGANQTQWIWGHSTDGLTVGDMLIRHMHAMTGTDDVGTSLATSTLTDHVDFSDGGSSTLDGLLVQSVYKPVTGAAEATLFGQSAGLDAITPAGKTPNTYRRQIVLKAAASTAPSNSVPPSVSGTAAVGQTLTADPGAWSGATSGPNYAWYRQFKNAGGTPGARTVIPGATAVSYSPVTGDADYDISVDVTYSNAVGSTTVSSSNVKHIPRAPVLVNAPAIPTGTPHTGDTITSTVGTYDAYDPPTSYTAQWFRNAAPITGETALSYLLQQTDEGANTPGITCHITAINGGGSITVVSNPIVPAVSAPLTDASYLIRYSGGAGNTDPSQSTGGDRGGTYPGGMDSLIGPLTKAQGQSGVVIYRAIFPQNTHVTTTANAGKAFISQPYNPTSGTPIAGVHADIAIPNEGVNTPLPVIGSDALDPASLAWGRPSDAASGLNFGSLAPGQYRGLWIRITVDPGTLPFDEADLDITVTFS